MRTSPKLIAAFAVVYLVWGSTYLAIHFAVESIPPFVLGGLRFTLAGAVLYAYTRLAGAPRPTRVHWRGATVIGGLLLLGGNGLVNFAEQTVPSGLAALIVGSMPVWMVLFDWLIYRGKRPTRAVWLGLAVGLAGVVVLVDPRRFMDADADLVGVLAVLAACMSWSVGSLHSRRVSLPSSPLMATAMEMLAGGALMLAVATARGEWGQFHPAEVGARSWLAFAYLVVFGSLLAFSTYVWLLKHASAAAVSTYAYVNPVVAVFLGWWLADERIGANTLLAAGMIIGAVVMITLSRRAANTEG